MARVDIPKLTASINDWYERKVAAVERGEPIPQIPNIVGQALIDIAQNFSRSAKFRRVPEELRDAMVSNGIDVALNAINKKFDPTKMVRTNSPYSFLNQAIYFGFLHTIVESKRQFNGRNSFLRLFIDGQSFIHGGDHHSLHTESLSDISTTIDHYRRDEARFDSLDYARAYEIRKKQEASGEVAHQPQPPKPRRKRKPEAIDTIGLT
jgi:hypothetical protein